MRGGCFRTTNGRPYKGWGTSVATGWCVAVVCGGSSTFASRSAPPPYDVKRIVPSPRLQIPPTAVGEDIILPKTIAPHYPSATAFLQTHLSTHRLLFRFFAKKTEPKSFQGLKRRPRNLPRFRCPSIRAAVCDFLPLRLCDEMRTGDILSYTSRTYAIGHRCM